MQSDLKAAIVTGASGGIGAAFANRLAGEGHNLLLVARSEDKLRQLCNELMQKNKIKAQYIAIDLTQDDADKIIFEEAQQRGLERRALR